MPSTLIHCRKALWRGVAGMAVLASPECVIDFETPESTEE
jgi:hypothetical protein